MHENVPHKQTLGFTITQKIKYKMKANYISDKHEHVAISYIYLNSKMSQNNRLIEIFHASSWLRELVAN